MKHNIFMRILMIALLCLAFPFTGWSLGTPQNFTVDLSSAQSSPVANNPLQVQMTNASINIASTNPLTGTTTTATSFFDVVWEFNYDNNHLQIGTAAAPDATCTFNRTVTVTDSRTGAGISNATVTIGGTTQTTDALGSATFTGVTAPASGNVNIQANATNYTSGNTAVNVSCNSTGTTNITLMNNSNVTGNITIITTWGQNPRDLDSHLTGPKTTGTTRFHVYYAASNRAGTGAAMTNSNATIPSFLDRDDTTSFGPETITITRPGGSFVDGVYRYSIHHFSGTSTIENSGAVVKVYQGATLLGTYTPPTPQTTGSRYWSVVEINISGGIPSVTSVGTYGSAFAASAAGSASGATPVMTPLGATVHTEDPAIFLNMPAK